MVSPQAFTPPLPVFRIILNVLPSFKNTSATLTTTAHNINSFGWRRSINWHWSQRVRIAKPMPSSQEPERIEKKGVEARIAEILQPLAQDWYLDFQEHLKTSPMTKIDRVPWERKAQAEEHEQLETDLVRLAPEKLLSSIPRKAKWHSTMSSSSLPFRKACCLLEPSQAVEKRS